jgi:hypothetical protein
MHAARARRSYLVAAAAAPAPLLRLVCRSMDSMDFNIGAGVVDSRKALEGFTTYTQRGLDGVLSRIEAATLTVLCSASSPTGSSGATGYLSVTAYTSDEPLPFERRFEGTERQLQEGDKWGGLFDCAWMHFSGVVPTHPPADDGGGGGIPVLLLDVSGEMCVVDDVGRPVRGLTSLSSEFDLSLGRPGKHVLPLPPGTAGGAVVDVWADCGCNDLFGNLQHNGVLCQAAIAVLHEEVQALYFDMEVLCDLLKVLPEASARSRQVLRAVSAAAKELQPVCDVPAARRARRHLAPQLAKSGGDPDLCISACGHAHMDLAWLWPIRETMRKAARTFATALAHMREYPRYTFGASQPQQLQWIKEQHPTMYAEIVQRVREGRWECQGAMWVEPDTNITGGESLVRQLLLGTAFWREEFGVEPTNMWEPDVFGYSAALPQILRKAGVHFMMTQKLVSGTVHGVLYELKQCLTVCLCSLGTPSIFSRTTHSVGRELTDRSPSYIRFRKRHTTPLLFPAPSTKSVCADSSDSHGPAVPPCACFHVDRCCR